ncbi:MAG: polysaccharide deacetylase family protein [Proteobacteria bacterium]|nr:polysaccharide deacetylase family protein [Pseudomonadota bacterium]
MSKSALLKTCFDVLHYSGASTVLGPYFRGQGAIFCLHHVRPGGGHQTGFAPNANLEITPEFLDDMLSALKRWGYQFLSLTEACHRMQAAKPSSTPFAVFTLDDGYLDNLVHAMPVFKRHKCPFTVFAAPRIVEGTCELWWVGLEHVIAGSGNELALELGGEALRLPTATDAEKWATWKRLFPLVHAMPEYEQRDWIRALCERHGIDLNALCRAAAMNWQQLREMSREPLASIGAHTLNHYAVIKLSEDDARREIIESGARLAAELETPIEHFAYPYGNVAHAGPRDFEICKEAGYLSGVTTRHGVVFAEHASHLEALPRVMVSGKYQKVRYLEALVSGLPATLANGFRKVNVS